MKNSRKINNQAGFSLIETIIYLALFGIVIGGVVVSVYAMFESSGKNQTKAMVQEEGTYLLGKIDWALTGALAVDTPSISQLAINRSGTPPLSLVFDASGGQMTLARGTATPEILDNTNTTVTNPVFVRTLGSPDGVTPESVKASFTLSALTPTGSSYSQDFTTTKYLRK